jgi:hypothetical protein
MTAKEVPISVAEIDGILRRNPVTFVHENSGSVHDVEGGELCSCARGRLTRTSSRPAGAGGSIEERTVVLIVLSNHSCKNLPLRQAGSIEECGGS